MRRANRWRKKKYASKMEHGNKCICRTAGCGFVDWTLPSLCMEAIKHKASFCQGNLAFSRPRRARSYPLLDLFQKIRRLYYKIRLVRISKTSASSTLLGIDLGYIFFICALDLFSLVSRSGAQASARPRSKLRRAWIKAKKSPIHHNCTARTFCASNSRISNRHNILCYQEPIQVYMAIRR